MSCSNAVLAAIIVLALVIVAAVACHYRGVRGAVVLVGGLAIAAASLAMAGFAAANGSRFPRIVRGGAAPKLLPFHGAMLTAEEIAEVKKVLRPPRQPMSRLPTAVDDLPARLPYRPSVYPRRLAMHNGQRKLLLSEVDFLTDYARKGDTVVYAGAAPGIHIPYLASLFHAKGLRFELYDPRKFLLPKGRAEANERIAARREFFTDETAASYAGRDDILFISDVRTGTDETEIPSEETVSADMTLQEGWVLAMQPRAAMLKFRLGYGGAPVEYLAGTVRLQAWTGYSSAEARLVAARDEGAYARKYYDPASYERQMFYFNSIIREWAAFDHGIPLGDVSGLDYCYGCALEAHIWKKYLGRAATPSQIATLFNRTTVAISRGLDKPPHGVDPMTPMPERRQHLLERFPERGPRRKYEDATL